MAKIYISSTYSDLAEYREKVYKALRKVGQDPIAMEDYVATGKYPPLDKCLADVADSDIYVGIFAWRYGYIPQDNNPQQKSITELEYRQAAKEDKPCFIFLLHEDTPWSPKSMDRVKGDGDAGNLIEAFRQELSTTKLVSFFKNPDELATLVTVAIQNWEKENPNSQSDNKNSSNSVTSNINIDNSHHVSKGNRTINIGKGNYIKNVEGDYVQGNKTNQSRNVKITGGTINASGAGAFSLGDISGTVANTINQGTQYHQTGNFGIGHMSGGTIKEGAKAAGIINEIPDSSNSDQSEIKLLLAKLEVAITISEDLGVKRKTKALKQVELLAQAAKNPVDENLRESAEDAITMLKGINSNLPDHSALVTMSEELLPAIRQSLKL